MTRDNEFLPALKEALKANRPALIEVMTELEFLPHGHLVAGDPVSRVGEAGASAAQHWRAHTVTTTTLRLTAAVRSHGGALPLLSGDIAMDGLLDQIKVEPQIAAYRRMVRDLAFDVCELAPTTYLCAKAFNKQFTAIPVFLTRDFHHRSVVCNVASGIKEPKDLIGKKFGVRAYTVTTGVWTRGILESEYGVDPAQVTWYTDDEEHVTEWVPPSNVVHLPLGESLAAMIAAGQLDAALSGAAGIGRSGPPTANWEAAAAQAVAAPTAAQLVPLFPRARVRGGVVPADGDFPHPRPHRDQERRALRQRNSHSASPQPDRPRPTVSFWRTRS